MMLYFLSSILIVGLIRLAETKEGVIYYVSPTEPLSSCPGNSSCPPNQHCHTMDYLAEHSSEFFSPDQVNVTLIFMCGVHNHTKDLTVRNHHSFVMKGATESRENVIINHQIVSQFGKPNCTIIQFFNISSVNITTLTLRCPAMNLKESHITLKSCNLYGYPGIEESLSFINITASDSQALLDNCTFKENCVVTSNFSDGIIVSDSTFQYYRHQIIVAFSSVVTLTGSVNFTDSITGIHLPAYSSSGTAVFLRTTHPEFKSSLTITTGAIVYFVNLTCDNYGGAVYGENATIHIGDTAKVVFMHNVAIFGGAVYVTNGAIVAYTESNTVFAYNHANEGGAIKLINGKLISNTYTNLTFSNNSAKIHGGSIVLVNSTFNVNTECTVHFYNNTGPWGGAMYFMYGSICINSVSTAFIMNKASVQGGAVYIESGVQPSIIVGDSASVQFFNNSAIQGGAIYTIPSSFTIEVGYHSITQFINNTALDVGGAVYSQEMRSAGPCIALITDYSAQVSFIRNYANKDVGHHVYGASVRTDKCDAMHMQLANKRGKPYCWHRTETGHKYIKSNISFYPGLNETLSPVSSAPERVCLCGTNGKPQCANISQIFKNIHVYRGETFTLSAHVVGYDFGTTVGTVHAGFLDPNAFSFLGQSQNTQSVNNSEICTNLEYTLFTKQDTELLMLQTSVFPVPIYGNKTALLSGFKHRIEYDISDYLSHANGCLSGELLVSPIFINITLLPGCPPGLILNHNRSTCGCYSVLVNNGFKCSIQNKSGFLQWNSTVWINATFNESHSTGIIHNRFCPLLYCKSGDKTVNIGEDSSKQCASNRTGILCGACMENFSLAIGSSRCIECSNSHNMALLLAFTAAGVFLVFFILTLNLTVTQGLINGVTFYANIVWAYRIILFPSDIGGNYNILLTYLQVIVAWLNLDFGIEICFFVGLDAYWKTWLQFLFPFYIWIIAGVIIVACHYSSCLTNLIGSRAVPLLATLFLLSYMKLLRTIIDATSVAVIAQYPQSISYAVWYLDGNLRYCQHPHIYLFIAAIATLVFLWLPYTLLLLFIQPLRRVSHLRPLKWINKLAPVFDAYFSPLNDKHQYWFGITLLIRGMLLVLLTVTSVANPELNMFVLFLFMAFIYFFMSIKNVYKQVNVRLLESATILNLIVLSAGTLYKWESTVPRTILLEVSIGVTFAQFCVTVVWSLIKPCLGAGWKCRQNQGYDVVTDDDITHERIN